MKTDSCISIIEIFRTTNGSVSQCNKTNKYILEFGDIICSFKATDFIDFARRVNKLKVEDMILSCSPLNHVEVLMPPYSERCFVLTVSDILNLRELLGGTKFTLHLNSIICECLLPQLYNI